MLSPMARPIVVSGSCDAADADDAAVGSCGQPVDHVAQVLPGAASPALARRVQHQADVERRLQQAAVDQPLDLLEHRRVVDLELGLDAAVEHLRANHSICARGLSSMSARPSRVKNRTKPMFSEHISGLISAVLSRSSYVWSARRRW